MPTVQETLTRVRAISEVLKKRFQSLTVGELIDLAEKILIELERIEEMERAR